MPQLTPEEILALPIGKNDARGAKTIGAYLKALLGAFWKEKDCFSAKKPLGSSDWEFPIYEALAAHGVIKALKADDGHIDEKQIVKADGLIAKAIRNL